MKAYTGGESFTVMPVLSNEDRLFLDDLFRRYQRLMFQTVFRITENLWDTEDIIQIVVIKLTEKLHLLRSMDNPRLSAYLVTACRNTALTYLREVQRRAECPYSDALAVQPQDVEVQPPRSDADERLLAFRRAWRVLDQRTKYILYSRYLEKKSFQEIASSLNIQPKSARMALTRAKRKAKAAILKELHNWNAKCK